MSLESSLHAENFNSVIKGFASGRIYIELMPFMIGKCLKPWLFRFLTEIFCQ